jgi:tetratricopeptide (TPR) repeat protein
LLSFFIFKELKYFKTGKMKKILIIVFTLFFVSANGLSQYKASDYLRAALVATKNKKFTQAIILCDAAINLSNTYESAYFHRGYNKLLLKDYAGALIDFDVVIELNPDNLDAWLYRALTNHRAGNGMAASSDINSARKIDMIQTLAFVSTNIFR